MKEFAILINALDSTNKTGLKQEAIETFLAKAPDEDKLWFLALFTGKRPKRKVSTTLLKQWAIEIAGIPAWLFQESYAAVGDLGETISLILPEPVQYKEQPLAVWMEQIKLLELMTEPEKKQYVINAWQNLPHTERFIFNKLLGGSFRVGIAAKSLINAIAGYYKMEASAVAHTIMGEWHPDQVTFDALINGEHIQSHRSKPYPFCLAYALDKELSELGMEGLWQAEYKWDGIRAQLIKRGGEVFIWSRGEELITDQFPEIKDALLLIDGNFVIDGELLVHKDEIVQNFSELQKRLNRKNISRKMLQDLPVVLFAYDLLEWENADWRAKQLSERRQQLEHLFIHNSSHGLRLSPVIHFSDWEELALIRETARLQNSEGLMLKQKESPYHSGRKRGDWWKWKIDPLTLDAVLIYAQKGSGRRSGYYTDYTFAVKDGENLVTIAKAYSGLTDKEIQEVSRFVNNNALEKFGPVRTVKPELVFELAFEGISFSNRHKSGVALRFPRILRWRRDKTVNDIDDIESIKQLIR
ncbi:ATP-dependent DNA ligase [Polluticaenibacter yanchengensis]|uniref:DNA ligase (ATP) n=1 Tax=Polluticaenibacter yanchengensis TaxID=3014562 RepID=A0ABT4UGY3_9BACT|nr:ATP-dependent DNA ligase [Chitinophagaceae bacterium LY-5]